MSCIVTAPDIVNSSNPSILVSGIEPNHLATLVHALANHPTDFVVYVDTQKNKDWLDSVKSQCQSVFDGNDIDNIIKYLIQYNERNQHTL